MPRQLLKHMRKVKSKLTKASSKFESLRTTIPQSGVIYLGLEEGDYIEWEQQIVNGKKTLVITKSSDKK
jgi:hypothetical protein